MIVCSTSSDETGGISEGRSTIYAHQLYHSMSSTPLRLDLGIIGNPWFSCNQSQFANGYIIQKKWHGNGEKEI